MCTALISLVLRLLVLLYCLYIGDVSHVSIVCKPIACMLRCNERVAIEVVKD